MSTSDKEMIAFLKGKSRLTRKYWAAPSVPVARQRRATRLENWSLSSLTASA